MKNPTIPPDTPTTANQRYSPSNLGAWSSISDVDTFFSRFNHANDYKDGDVELSLGNIVTIQDGTYNTQWVIAGFDLEYNQLAADGTIYNNGLGICMVPQIQVTTGQWNTSNTVTGGYMSSNMRNTVLPGVATNLQNVLGSHIVNRNVLLSSSISGGYYPDRYTWTTAYATLMSSGQMTGRFAADRNKYDDGEANYKLPVFSLIDYKTGSKFWTRGLSADNILGVRTYSSDGSLNYDSPNATCGVRPLIYLR